MLRSTDAGLTWEPTGAGIPALDQVLSIAVEPGPPYRVFVITEGGLGAGLYLSEDHGVSWRQADSPMLGFNTEQIIFAPSDPPVLYAGAHQGLFRSTDGAQSWKQAAGVLGQVPVYSLAAAKAEGRVILYVGTTGGYVEGRTDLTGFRNLSGLTNGVLVPAGVYRWGSRLLNQRVYLPLILKGYAP
jgi:hypothetical protein